MNATPARILVIGDANADLVLHGDVVPRFGQAEQLLTAADLVLGGSAAIVACGLARLGVPTSLVAVIADDLSGHEVLSALIAAGVSTEAIDLREGEVTGLSVHLSALGDRAILTLPGSVAALDAAAVRAAVERCDPQRVHVASPFLIPRLTAQLPSLLAEWRAAGIGSSLDTNWDPSEQWIGITECLADLDVLLPNAVELGALAALAVPEGRDADSAAAAIAALGPRVVVKSGADGGRSFDRFGMRWDVRGLTVDVVDTTGAGDSFDAGYLAALAYGIEDEAVRLRWATVAGSLSTRAAGGTAGQATLDELRAAV
ncbi:sugar kinase [soil metagenome]